MKEIQRYINAKKAEFSRLPFFAFLGSNAPIEARLEWARPLAFFAMSFKDINQYALYKPLPETFLDKIINQHAKEDGRHWRWYLADIKNLGYNASMTFVEALQFLWGEETKHTRTLCYDLFSLLLREDDSLVKLAIIEAIEATGVVALPLMAELGNEYEAKHGKKLAYFSPAHAAVETGHIISDMSVEETEAYLQNLEFSAEQKARAITGIDIVFEGYTKVLQSMPQPEPCLQH